MYIVYITLPDLSIIVPVLQVLITMVFATTMISLIEKYVPFLGA